LESHTKRAVDFAHARLGVDPAFGEGALGKGPHAR
jgi:hypothetical protein